MIGAALCKKEKCCRRINVAEKGKRDSLHLQVPTWIVQYLRKTQSETVLYLAQ